MLMGVSRLPLEGIVATVSVFDGMIRFELRGEQWSVLGAHCPSLQRVLLLADDTGRFVCFAERLDDVTGVALPDWLHVTGDSIPIRHAWRVQRGDADAVREANMVLGNQLHVALGARHVPDSDTCTADEWSHGLAYFDVLPAVPRIRLQPDRR